MSLEVRYTGAIANPLASPSLKIGWNVNTALVEDTSTGLVNVQVSGNVTCFPAHEIIFQGQQVAYYYPSSSNLIYVGACLAAPTISPISGTFSGPAAAVGGINVAF